MERNWVFKERRKDAQEEEESHDSRGGTKGRRRGKKEGRLRIPERWRDYTGKERDQK